MVLILILAALLEPVKLGNNSILGFAMGLCIGLMQWLLIRKNISHSFKWVWLLIVGLTVPLIVLELLASLLKNNLEPYLLLMVVVGGLISGYLQYHFFLSKIFNNAKSWIRVSFLGWLAAIAILSLTFLPAIFHEEINSYFKMINMIAIILCGPSLGFNTGKGIVSILKNDVS